MMKMLVATNNKGKLREFNDIFGELGIECVSLKELNIDADVEENGKTFLENAKMFFDFLCSFIAKRYNSFCGVSFVFGEK